MALRPPSKALVGSLLVNYLGPKQEGRYSQVRVHTLNLGKLWTFPLVLLVNIFWRQDKALGSADKEVVKCTVQQIRKW